MFKALKNKLLDASIFWSFDRTGYERHRENFDPSDLAVDMSGKRCLVTGANSGLGLEIARTLAIKGATVHMLCRNKQRAEDARADIRASGGERKLDLRINLVDLSDMRSVRSFCNSFDAPIDVLVHNAGLLPQQRQLTDLGLELTVAVHVLGPWLMNHLLRPQLRDARVITVTSGGMYSKRLDVDAMLSNEGNYDGVAAYARTKRAQVVLNRMWAERSEEHRFHSMHPGWAATSGVQTSLPGFFKRMEGRLRTAAQGADTAVWLAVAPGERPSGKLWFDRQQVSETLLPLTSTKPEEAQKLWDWCETTAGAANP